MADALVLDTSACFAFLEDEAGADVVESYLVEAKEGRMVIRSPNRLLPVSMQKRTTDGHR